MKTLLALIAGAIVGWWAGRDYEFRQWELCDLRSRLDDSDDEMDAVQPSDPWPPMVRGNVMPLDEDEMCPNCVTPWKCNGPHDLTYLQADTFRAMRMSAQNGDTPTGGM